MSSLIIIFIGLFIGIVLGYFVAALMMMSKVSDLESELIMVRENKQGPQEISSSMQD